MFGCECPSSSLRLAWGAKSPLNKLQLGSLTGLATRRHPWSAYAVFQTTLTAGAIYDLFMFFSLGLASAGDEKWSPYWTLIMTSLAMFWVFTKISKVSGHYLRYPADVCYVPLQIAFGIFHTFCIKIPAFCTMNEVSGSSLPWFTKYSFHCFQPPPFSVPRTRLAFLEANYFALIRRPGEAEKARIRTTRTGYSAYHLVPTRLIVCSKSDSCVSFCHDVACYQFVCKFACLRDRPHDTRMLRFCFRSASNPEPWR